MPKFDAANRIYSEFYGHLDDRRFKAAKLQEINDWLTQGDPEDMTPDELMAEWAEYDAAEIAEAGPATCTPAGGIKASRSRIRQGE